MYVSYMWANSKYVVMLIYNSCLLFVSFLVCACTLKNHTLWLEKENCTQCVAVNTTICSGYCYTKDTNLKGRFGRTFLIQRSCVPLSLVYRAAHIPGCPPGVSSQLYYPAAQCCSCSRCDTRYLTHFVNQPVLCMMRKEMTTLHPL
uniref:Gonadotropin subunit beta-2 n=1 Tax=Stegastes partitus TaxID=144197 RepID=A0A3B4Z9C5_9TELE